MPDDVVTNDEYTPLTWDNEGERLFETGVSKGVLFVYDSTTKTYGNGVAWNGLTNVSEKPSGAEPTALYADDIKYLNLISAEEFAATIEAYMYPKEFGECDGSAEIAKGVTIGQQKRKKFAFSYVTKVGNDIESSDYGEKVHIIYGCMAAPTEKGYATINDSPEAPTMSWEISTTPINVAGMKPTASVTIDSTVVKNDTKMTALKTKLWGSTTAPSTLPTIQELITMFGTGNG